MIIAGIDLGGAKAAVVVLDDDELVHAEVFTSRAERRQDQLFEVADFCEQVSAIADVVYVEEPIIGRGVQASLKIAQACGAVLSALSTPAYLVSNTSWKKKIVGSGNAAKEAVSFWLRGTHPDYYDSCDEDQDLADATCIALFGRATQDVARSLRRSPD